MTDMPRITWNIQKEKEIRDDGTRGGISFADCVIAIDDGRVLDNLAHPTRGDQRLLILDIDDYAYVVPYLREADGSWFLKTVFPSRKHTALYLGKRKP